MAPCPSGGGRRRFRWPGGFPQAGSGHGGQQEWARCLCRRSIAPGLPHRPSGATPYPTPQRAEQEGRGRRGWGVLKIKSVRKRSPHNSPPPPRYVPGLRRGQPAATGEGRRWAGSAPARRGWVHGSLLAAGPRGATSPARLAEPRRRNVRAAAAPAGPSGRERGGERRGREGRGGEGAARRGARRTRPSRQAAKRALDPRRWSRIPRPPPRGWPGSGKPGARSPAGPGAERCPPAGENRPDPPQPPLLPPGAAW